MSLESRPALAGIVALAIAITIGIIAAATSGSPNAGQATTSFASSPVADCGNADATMVNGLCTEPSNEVTQTGVAPPPVPTITTETTPALPSQEQQAIGSAQDYLSYAAFSRQGLINQLDSAYGAGYPVDIATAAVDSLTVDWNAQAVKSAQSYLAYTHFSCNGLIHQLDSAYGAGFTTAQATYGAHQTIACR